MWASALTPNNEIYSVILKKNYEHNISCYEGRFRLRVAGSWEVVAEYNSNTHSYTAFTIPGYGEVRVMVESWYQLPLLMPMINGHEFETKWSSLDHSPFD